MNNDIILICMWYASRIEITVAPPVTPMTGKSKELKSEVQLEQADEKTLIEEPENKELNRDNLMVFFEFLYKRSLDNPILSDECLNIYI